MVKEIYAHLPPDYGYEKPKEGKVWEGDRYPNDLVDPKGLHGGYEADKHVYGITREGKKVEVREADVPRKIHQVYLEGWYSRDELIQIAAMKEMSNG